MGYVGTRPDLAELNRARRHVPKDTHVCTKCKTPKLRTAFGKHKEKGSGLQSWCQDCTKPHARKFMREKIVRLRNEVLALFGSQCGKCGFNDKRALQVDHVLGNGKQDKNRGIPMYKKVLTDTTGMYQLLCANCNWIKRHERGELPPRINDAN